MKNYESLFAKIEESTEEFKKNLRYNKLEDSRGKCNFMIKAI